MHTGSSICQDCHVIRDVNVQSYETAIDGAIVYQFSTERWYKCIL